ncbi:MAG: hypothetical protein KDD15_29515 [Lewinella sp.]|nr:hypothetical protein [Lewinella sp.]
MNNNLSYRLSALLFALALCLPGLQAQDLPGGEVDVIKSFDARLLDADKINIRPELPPLDTITKLQTYSALNKTLEVDYLPPQIRPLAMLRDGVPQSYNGFLKVGAGLPNAFYGEGSYYITTVKNLDFGINARHFSANNNKKVENQRFSETYGAVDGTYYFDQGFAVNGKMKYNRDAVYFYGYNKLNEQLDTNQTPYSFEPEEIKQRFNIIDASGSIFNGERTEADFNYFAGVDAYLMRDNYAARENGLKLTLDATKWFRNSDPLQIKLITDFTSFKNSEKQTLNNFYLQPSYTYHADRFKVKVGLNVTSHEDDFSFFPDIEASANIIEGLIGAYVGAGGDLKKNTFRSLSDYNPYIESKVDLENTRYYHFYGGVKGNFKGVDYDAQIGYKTTENLALFVISDFMDSIPRFDAIYDSVDIFLFKASLSAPIFKGFELMGSVSQSIFSPQREEKAWHLPTLSVNATARYTTPDQNIRFTGEFFLENGVSYKAADGTAKNLNALFDISAGVEYFFTENIGGFVQLNNLANNRRQRWQNYPTFGLNALIGVSARF